MTPSSFLGLLRPRAQYWAGAVEIEIRFRGVERWRYEFRILTGKRRDKDRLRALDGDRRRARRAVERQVADPPHACRRPLARYRLIADRRVVRVDGGVGDHDIVAQGGIAGEIIAEVAPPCAGVGIVQIVLVKNVVSRGDIIA